MTTSTSAGFTEKAIYLYVASNQRDHTYEGHQSSFHVPIPIGHVIDLCCFTMFSKMLGTCFTLTTG